MRLRAEAGALVLTAALCGATALAAQADQPQPAAPGDAEIARALELVKADPSLNREQTITMLRWRDQTDRTRSGTPGWVRWIIGFFGWIARSARVLVWGAAIVLAGMLVVYILRLVRGRPLGRRDEAFVAPTHVRDLDIRPESLPDDLGRAARALWDAGDQRTALALLYRGLLSRLAHVHQVPIRDSSTEGDCLALAERYLATSPRDYASRLIHVWQRFVYAGQDVQSGAVYVLCDDFAPALDATARGDHA